MSDHAGAAKRRRERRLRSWLQHERMTVAMVLSEALHHSAQKVEVATHDALRGLKADRTREGEVREPHDALRGQKRPPPGTRPAPLVEVAAPEVLEAARAPYLLRSVRGWGAHCGQGCSLHLQIIGQVCCVTGYAYAGCCCFPMRFHAVV